ncbi:MAG: hypothetical protein RR949_08375 [Oscillospiraceae bacterium]
MYRIAIIDNDPDARELTHRLAAAFFAQRKESAAFVICENSSGLPGHYDCYLSGESDSLSLRMESEAGAPLEQIQKPVEQEAFFEMLAHWQKDAVKAAPRRSVKRGVTGL